MKRVLWVVEMLCHGGWQPTVGIAISREDGRLALRKWKSNNPCDKFRLVKYVPAKARKGAKR